MAAIYRRVDDASERPARVLASRRALLGGQNARFDHGRQHDFRAGLSEVGIPHRVVAGGRFQKARHHGGLVHRQVFGRPAEVALRRRFDAVGAGAEIDAVQIEAENLIFGEALLKLNG